MVGRWRPAVVAAILLVAPVSGRQHDDPQATVQALLTAYSLGQYELVDRTLAAQPKGPLAADLIREGDRWIKTGPADVLDRRRMIAGAIALEIAGAGLKDEWFLVYPAIEWGCARVVATAPGSPAERAWHLGSISLLQDGAGIAPTTVFAEGHIVRHSLKRVPDSASIQLGAVIDEERGLSMPPPQRPGQPPYSPQMIVRFKSRSSEVMLHYSALVTAAELGDEARLRLGAFQYRINALDDAMVMLAPLRQSVDPYVGYVAAFLSGEAMRLTGRGAEAMAAYRQALAFAPNAMSASLGLSSVLAASGDIDGAIAAVRGAATTAAPVDPWRVFAYGTGRQWPHWRDSLRQEMKR